MRYSSAGRLALSALMLSVVSLTGCMSTMEPKMPKELGAPSLSSYSQADFKSDVDHYRAAVSAPDLPTALALRNQIAYRVMANIESEYGSFEMRLTTQRAGFETGADAVQLGIAAATTVVGASEVKDLLSASLSAFQGTRLSVDKNFFQQKTTESIISQMRTTRKTLQAQLILNLATRDVSSYPLDAVWIDLVDFYYAGTVPSALVGIASSTGASAEVATKKLSDTVAELTPCTPAQAGQFVGIRSAYGKLAAALNGQDTAKAASAVPALQKILTAAGITPNPDGKGADLLVQFRLAITSAKCGEALTRLDTAVSGVDLE